MTLAPKTAPKARSDADASLDPVAWAAEVDRLTQEVSGYARGRKRRLVGLSVRIPEPLRAARFLDALHAQLEARGLSRPRVLLTRGDGPILLVSVEFARLPDGGAR